MKGNSFVASALREQKALNLPWYKNVKCLLENDDIYSLDHVSAHRALKSQPIKAGAKICRGNEGQKSRYRDKPKCEKSRHCRGKNRKNRGNVAAKIVKIAALSRQIV